MMGRRKGEMTPAQLDREYPHQVAVGEAYAVANFIEIKGRAQALGVAPRGRPA